MDQIPMFRAWDIKQKGWISGFVMVNYHVYFNKGTKPSVTRYDKEWKDGEYILVQEIGLFDKRGIEKAAGDINRVSWCNGFDWGTGYIYGVIEQQKGAWGIKVIRGRNLPEKHKDFVPFYIFEGEPDEDEIIGNIYENPELAKADGE